MMPKVMLWERKKNKDLDHEWEVKAATTDSDLSHSFVETTNVIRSANVPLICVRRKFLFDHIFIVQNSPYNINMCHHQLPTLKTSIVDWKNFETSIEWFQWNFKWKLMIVKIDIIKLIVLYGLKFNFFFEWVCQCRKRDWNQSNL